MSAADCNSQRNSSDVNENNETLNAAQFVPVKQQQQQKRLLKCFLCVCVQKAAAEVTEASSRCHSRRSLEMSQWFFHLKWSRAAGPGHYTEHRTTFSWTPGPQRDREGVRGWGGFLDFTLEWLQVEKKQTPPKPRLSFNLRLKVILFYLFSFQKKLKLHEMKDYTHTHAPDRKVCIHYWLKAPGLIHY